MAYNLIVAYDLNYPGQNYDAVRDCIRSLGATYQFQYSLFYLKTELSPDAAHNTIRLKMDINDKLLVAEATGGVVSYYPATDIDAVNFAWFTPDMRVLRAATAYLPQV
jgi:hypothetical protein